MIIKHPIIEHLDSEVDHREEAVRQRHCAQLQWTIENMENDKVEFLSKNNIAGELRVKVLQDMEKDQTIYRVYSWFTPESLASWKLKFE
jgi:hypothetical protein